MFEISFILALVLGVNELLKRYEYIPKRFIPLSSVLLGILFVAITGQYTIQEAILTGTAIGLSANGLFDMTKLVTKK